MLTTLPSDVRDVALGFPPLPDWVKEFRDHQVEGIEQTMGYLSRGTRVVLVNAPTGSGKTLIAEVVRRLHVARRALYVCTTKTLQEQFARDFPYAKVLKGRRNYPTHDFPELFNDPFKPTTAGDCTKEGYDGSVMCTGCVEGQATEPEDPRFPPRVLHCDNCHPWWACPYEVAKMEALHSEIAVTNTAYFLGEANGVGRLSRQHLVMVDECDTLESLLMSQIEVVIGERQRKSLGLKFPSKKTVESAWVEWVHESLPIVHKAMSRAKAAIRHRRTRERVKEYQRIERLYTRLDRMAEQISNTDDVDWIYDSAKQREGQIVFRPVKVDKVAREMLWDHGAQWVLMSATIIDPTEFTESLGLHDGWATVNVPNTFPKENRPVFAIGGPSMAKKNIDETRGGDDDAVKKMGELVARVLRKHPDDRVLVHTVSYKLAQELFDLLRSEFMDRLIVYGDGADREKALVAYKEKTNAVGLAPSWDRGVDLPGDLCRVQVIAKVPFPNLGDKQVNARLYSRGGDLWYRVNTVRTLVQMLGRGVRSRDDWCVTYILDRQFMDNVWSKSRMLFPPYVREAIDFSGGGLRGGMA